MKKEKMIRILKALFILSFLLDLTIIGAVVGIPMFIILWGLQYFFIGKADPFYVFSISKQQKVLLEIKNYDFINTQIEALYKTHFSLMQIDNSFAEMLEYYMADCYLNSISEIETLIYKNSLRLDGGTRAYLVRLLDCEAIMKASADLAMKIGYFSREEIAASMPKKSLLEFLADNKYSITPSLADDRAKDIKKAICLLDRCAQIYNEKLETFKETRKEKREKNIKNILPNGMTRQETLMLTNFINATKSNLSVDTLDLILKIQKQISVDNNKG